MGVKEDGVLTGLALELYDASGKVYYMSVKAVNSAGVESSISVSR